MQQIEARNYAVYPTEEKQRNDEVEHIFDASYVIGHMITTRIGGCMSNLQRTISTCGLNPRRLTVVTFTDPAEIQARSSFDAVLKNSVGDSAVAVPGTYYSFNNIYNPRRIWVMGSGGRRVRLYRQNVVPNMSRTEELSAMEYYTRDIDISRRCRAEKRWRGRVFYCIGSCYIYGMQQSIVFLYERTKHF